jgi:hypothetical protein
LEPVLNHQQSGVRTPETREHWMRLAAAILALTFPAATMLCGTGCAPYRVGVGSMFPSDITTVQVPIFESESFRRDLGERLTEAVAKRIENESNYKLVRSGNADSVLTGRILDDRKRTLVENRNDDVRETELTLRVQVVWTRRDGTILAQGSIPIDPSMAVDVVGSAPITPEVGQSIATGQQKAIDRLAAQIVGLMEAPW